MRLQLPIRLRGWRLALMGGAGVVLLSLLGLGPVSVQAELSASEQAFTTALSHRATVDAAMALFLSPNDPNQSQAPNAIRAESDRRLGLYRDALAEVTTDRARVKQGLMPLDWLATAALSKSADVTLARQRAHAALTGLAEAEAVLTAAIDQEVLGRAIFEGALKENDMLDAMRTGQYAEVHRIYAQADQQVRAAETRQNRADQPPTTRVLVGSLRALIDATDKLAGARLGGDSQDQARREADLKRAIADFATYSSDRQLAANRTWNETTFQRGIAAYDAALSQDAG